MAEEGRRSKGIEVFSWFHSVSIERVLRGRTPDTHAVERAVDEDERDGEESGREDVRQVGTLSGRHLHGEFDGEQAEERGELDNGVERDGRSVLERIADRIAD